MPKLDTVNDSCIIESDALIRVVEGDVESDDEMERLTKFFFFFFFVFGDRKGRRK